MSSSAARPSQRLTLHPGSPMAEHSIVAQPHERRAPGPSRRLTPVDIPRKQSPAAVPGRRRSLLWKRIRPATGFRPGASLFDFAGRSPGSRLPWKYFPVEPGYPLSAFSSLRSYAVLPILLNRQRGGCALTFFLNARRRSCSQSITRTSLGWIWGGVPRHSRRKSLAKPQGQGFIPVTRTNDAGNVSVADYFDFTRFFRLRACLEAGPCRGVASAARPLRVLRGTVFSTSRQNWSRLSLRKSRLSSPARMKIQIRISAALHIISQDCAKAQSVR